MAWLLPLDCSCAMAYLEPLVNPLAVNGEVPRLIYKPPHRHMNPFIASYTITTIKNSWAFFNLAVAD